MVIRLNHKKIIDGPARHQVVIELNAHPRRFGYGNWNMDRRLWPLALQKKKMCVIAIDPECVIT